MSVSQTGKCNRTFCTFRLTVGNTYHSSQFHQCLIKCPRHLHSLHDFPQLFFQKGTKRRLHNIGIVRSHSRQDAEYISIHSRHRNLICNGGDRPGSVTSDSLQFQQFLIICRKFSTIFFHHLNGCLLHIPHAVVIA